MPKTIELLPKTFNYTIGINDNKNNLEKKINNEENEILIENKEIKGNISTSK
jgi:hypothetical protein